MSRSKPTRTFLACACALLVASTLLTPVSLASDEPLMFAAIPDFDVHGGGWGHGIGMSQYGAEGYSTVRGWDYEQIIEHYFQETDVRTLGSLGKTNNPWVKVNIDLDYSPGGSYAGRNYWQIRGGDGSSATPAYVDIRVSDGSTTVDLPSTAYHQLRGTGGNVFIDTDKDGSFDAGETRFGSSVTVTPLGGSPGLIVVRDPSGPYLNSSYPDGYPYMRYRGSMTVSVASGSTYKLQCLNRVQLEDYLYGVVPREMPASWSSEALKAQSVAARSYAWASNPASGGELQGTLACTASSQVYGAHSRLSAGAVVDHETARSEVQATAGGIAYHAATGTVVQTFFSSSMGGFTANIEDVWTGSSPKPYYTGVPDTYDYVHANPYASWTRSFTGLTLAARLASSSYTWAPPGAGTSVWVTGTTVERGPSGYPKWTTFTFSTGDTTVESSWDVRQALSLPSPNFRFSGVPVDRIQGPDRYETAVAIAERAYPGVAPAVVVARGDDFSDALVGSGLAGAAGGPLLLSRHDGLSSGTLAKLDDLDPSTVYVMGGEVALGPEVDAAIAARLPGATIVRIAGDDRFDTAAQAAAVIASLGSPGAAILASGVSWPDAAASSALASARGYPILLTRQDSLPGYSRTMLESLTGADVIVVGGDAVVSSKVRSQAAAAADGALVWLRDADRYGTSAAVARYCVDMEGFSATTIYMATGELYADALTGGTLAGVQEHPVVLTMSDRVKPGTASLLELYGGTVDTLGVFGGNSAVTPECLDEAQGYLGD